MTKTLFAVALLAAIIAPPAQAAQTDPLAQLDALPIEKLCSANGVIGHAFGDASMRSRTAEAMLSWGLAGSDIDRRIQLAAEYAPVRTAKYDTASWSNRIYGVTYELELGSEKAADTAADRLAARFHALGWEQVDDKVGVAGQFSVAGLDRHAVLLTLGPHAADEDHPEGLMLTITPVSDGMLIECVDRHLAEEASNEDAGDLPEGAPRPSPPPSAQPFVLDAALCTSEEGRKQAQDAISSRLRGSIGLAGEMMDYRGRLLVWKVDRLRKSGRISKEQLEQLIETIQMARNESSPDSFSRPDSPSLSDMLDARLKGLRGSRDPAEFCRQAIPVYQQYFAQSVSEMSALAGMQNGEIEKAIDAEAARLGVSWD